MTDFDPAPPGPRRVERPPRPGLWRGLSLLLALVATALVTMWILQSRAASDIAARNSRTLDLVTTDVFVDDDLPLPIDPRVAVLGFDHRQAVPIGLAGTQLEIPSGTPTLVGLLDGTGNVHGLRLVSRPEDRGRVVIDAASTAHALLVLSPAFLEADLERARQKVEFIAGDPAVDELTAALSVSPNIGEPNEPVESALAALLDRVRVNPLFDQGCDSILNPAARPVTGTCAVPGSSGMTINNEQDRWALVFAGPEPYDGVCAAVAPAGTPGSQRTVTTADCGDEALVAAPGPVVDRSAERAADIGHIREATVVQVFSAAAAPLADLVGGAAGINRSTNTHVLAAVEPLVAAAGATTEDPVFESALDVLVSSATPIERHAATVAATRVLLAEPSAYIEDWDAGASLHVRFLDFYDRVGERMQAADRSAWRWTADATGVLDLGGGS